MIRTILPAALAAVLFASTSSAAVLDFIEFANNNEHGVVSGTSINSPAFGGETVTFFANSTFNPYFDHGNAGLGVCKFGNFAGGQTGAGTGNKCLNASGGEQPDDDNVTFSEAVTIAWAGARTLSNLLFTGEWHGGTDPADIEYLHEEDTVAKAEANSVVSGSINNSDPRYNKTLLFAINGGLLSRYTFAELSAASFDGVTSATFAFDDVSFLFDDTGRDAEQFYLAAATISAVPLPAGLPLLLAGLGGLGLLRYRRKRA